MLKRTTIWMESKTLEALKAIGKRDERPIGWIIRKVMEEFVKQNTK